MPDSTWTNWQIYFPESLMTDSSYVGLVYGFIFEETKSICIVDDSLYFSPERIVGYIGTSAPVWPHSVIEKYSKTTFFTAKFTNHIIEGYVISNNFAFGACPKNARKNRVKSVADILEIIQVRELEEIGKSTIIPYSINNTVNDSAEYWNAYVPDSILSNPMFCGGIYGECQHNSVFIFDTIKFPEKKNEKDRIGYIIGEGDDITASITVLRNDGNDIIGGEYIDSRLRLRLQNEGTHSDGTGWKEEEYTRIVIHKREESDSLMDEEVAALKFHLTFVSEVYPNNEDTTRIPTDSDEEVIPISSATNSDCFKPCNPENIEGIYNQFVESDNYMIKQDGTVINLADPMSVSSLVVDGGFEPVDAIIEPWFVPFWSMDSILEQIQQTDSESVSRMYRNLLELTKEFPIFEYIGKKLCIRLMDIESIKEALKIFPDGFVRMVADCYAEKHQTVINSRITVDQDAADDFVVGLQLLKKLHSAGFITCETVNTVDGSQKC